MFDHVKFGVSDYAASKAFFLQALAPLGVTLVGEGEPSYGAELAGSGDASLCLYQSAEKPAPLHIAFRADSRGLRLYCIFLKKVQILHLRSITIQLL